MFTELLYKNFIVSLNLWQKLEILTIGNPLEYDSNFNYMEWEKILLYAGNFFMNSPLVFSAFGKIYLSQGIMFFPMRLKLLFPKQSAGNFRLSTTAMASTSNTYNTFDNLPKISVHSPIHNSKLNDEEFGFF